MTGSEIITSAWQIAGSATDLDPTTTTGKARLVAAFNSEVPAVIGYKNQFRQLRTRFYRTKKIFKYVSYDVEVASVSSDEEEITISSITGLPTDVTEARIKDSEGEVRLIYDYDSASLTFSIDEAFTTVPEAGDTLTIYPTYVDMSDDLTVTRFVEILSVEDVIRRQKLMVAPQWDTSIRWSRTLGYPRRWWREGNRIWIDTPPDEGQSLKLRITYERMPDIWEDSDPTDVDVDTGTSIDLPQHFHEAVVWRLVWWIYQFRQEPDAAASALNTFMRYMDSLRMPDDYLNEQNQGFSNGVNVRLTQKGMF
jgi:hypothetical protein